MTFVPCLVRSMDGPELVSITLGHPLVDGYLEFVGARGAVNTWLLGCAAGALRPFHAVVHTESQDDRHSSQCWHYRNVSITMLGGDLGRLLHRPRGGVDPRPR